MIIKEVNARTILSKSKVSDYTINPYVGCMHSCIYCYARFMKRFTGHTEPWGEFIDVKINAPQLLEREVNRKPVGRVWISGICDPYQPIEKKYELTKKCLKILVENSWPVTVQTKSPLVLRDIEVLKKSEKIEVGFTVTTADAKIQQIFEPKAPPIEERIKALKRLHSEGVKTFVMIAPLLPRVDGLVPQLAGIVNYVLVDRMNYHYADSVYREYGLEKEMSDQFFIQEKERLIKALNKEEIPYQILF